jgi:xanthosine utilization system XapX-like protein
VTAVWVVLALVCGLAVGFVVGLCWERSAATRWAASRPRKNFSK